MMNKMFQKQGLAVLLKNGATTAQMMKMHTLRCLFTSQQASRRSALRTVNYGKSVFIFKFIEN